MVVARRREPSSMMVVARRRQPILFGLPAVVTSRKINFNKHITSSSSSSSNHFFYQRLNDLIPFIHTSIPANALSL